MNSAFSEIKREHIFLNLLYCPAGTTGERKDVHKMDLQLTLQFWIISLALTCSPGADWAYLIATSVRGIRIKSAVLGLATGYVIFITVVALGLGAVVSSHPLVLNVLSVVGGLYLIYLGASSLREFFGNRRNRTGSIGNSNEWKEWPESSPTPATGGHSPHCESSDQTSAVAVLERDRTTAQVQLPPEYVKGVTVTLLNPKSLLAMVALLPRFVNSDASLALGWQLWAIGWLQVINVLIVYAVVAAAAYKILYSRPNASEAINAVAGALMLAIGGFFVVDTAL